MVPRNKYGFLTAVYSLALFAKLHVLKAVPQNQTGGIFLVSWGSLRVVQRMPGFLEEFVLQF
jgi:hypothetical protein